MEVLSEVLRRSPPADPFVPAQVVVGSRGMEHWLRHELAERLSICANMEFPFPSHVLDASLDAVLGSTSPEVDPWSPSALAWAVLAALPELAESSRFSAVASWLGGDVEGPAGARRWGLAREVADVFDRYATFRPELALEWSESLPLGGGPDDWQRLLWQAAERLGGEAPHRATRMRDATARLRSGEAAALPNQPLRFFGLSSFPPVWLEWLGALSQHVDVELYALCPSPEFWADVRRKVKREKDFRGLEPGLVDEALRGGMDEGHPLLASLGRSARDLQVVLESLPDAYEEQRTDLFLDPLGEVESPEEAEPAPALHVLQSDVLAVRSPTQREPRALRPGDDSLQFHSCHGGMRQVEVLREVLLGLLQDHPHLEPRDIVVMTPDIERFAPLIAAVFSDGARDAEESLEGAGSVSWGPGGTPRVPWVVADRAARHSNPVAEVALRLLALASGRAEAREVVELLSLPPVRARFGLDAEGLEMARGWLGDAGARWGLDAAHREARGGPRDAQNTWEFALQRLVLGVAMAESAGLWAGVAPLDAAEGSDTEHVGAVVAFIKVLTEQSRRLAAPRSLEEWVSAVGSAVELLIELDDDHAWQERQVRDELEGLLKESAIVQERPQLTLEAVQALLDGRLSGASGRDYLPTGAVTFCSMVPMRSVPYRVVCLLGMDDGTFPRSPTRVGFDLTAVKPRLGDRDPRQEDRYLLLEALLAARDHVVVLFQGRDPNSNEPTPPAVPIGELLDVVDITFTSPSGPASMALTREHALQAFSRESFEASACADGSESAPWSFDPRLLRAVQRAESRRTEPVFLSRDLPEPALPTLDVVELAEALARPARFLLRQRLGVRARVEEAPLSNREPVELNGLEAWSLKDALMRGTQGGGSLDEVRAFALASGSLPLGEAGRQELSQRSSEVQGVLAEAEAFQGELESQFVPVDLVVGGIRLQGTLGPFYGNTRVHPTVSGEKPRQLLRCWVELLVAVASGAIPEARAVYVSVKSGEPAVLGVDTPSDALATLELLVRVYQRCCTQAVPLFEKTSWVMAKELQKGGLDSEEAVAKGLANAEEAWDGYRFPESQEPEHQTVWGERSPLHGEGLAGANPAFVELAWAVWAPVVSARRTPTQIKGWRS